jgi:hypothetical protein
MKPLIGRPLPVASLTRNDSSVSGTTVKDALETLSSGISGAGNVTADSPTTEGAVPAWSSTDRKLRSSSSVAIHQSASDKLESLASFRAVGAATDGTTVTFDLNLADYWKVTLGGNRTLAVSNVSVGQLIAIRLIQDATGGRTVTWWSGILWNHSLAPVLDPTAGGSDLIVLLCVGLDGYGVPIWEEVCRKSSAPRKGIYSDTDGSTITFDLRKSAKHKVTLGGTRTLALVESHVGQFFTLRITTAGHTVTWWSGISWAGGSAPTLSASGTDVFGFIETASGAYDGFVLGQGL